MKGMPFTQAEVTAKAGDTIEWLNNDSFAHTATARNGAFDIPLKKGETKQHAIAVSGKFAYYCRLHPNMKATITVSDP